MEMYNNILCVRGSSLIVSESNPLGIMPEGTYKSLVYRKKIRVVRRGCNETPALIEFETMPAKYRKLVKERFGDPKVEAQKSGLRKDINIKSEAVDYYKRHRIEYTDRIESLPEETQTLYANNAAVLDALDKAWNKHVVAIRGANKRPMASEFWKNAAAATQKLLTLKENKIVHDLPRNPRRLQEKLQDYKAEGYASLISKKFANTNSIKITEEVGRWLVARWSARVPEILTLEQLHVEYNLKAETMQGWEPLKVSKTIYDYLNQPEIEEQWYAARYGELAYKEKFGRQHRRKPLTQRDTIWYSDGTKLNYFYQDENGKTRTCNVYEVMDAYSECLLGYHISDTEDYEAQYFAYKMAIQVAGHKPYELKYDNQGGHRKLESSDLLRNLARHAVATAPYNGKSKTIESAFKRFQESYLHKEWYFTGQNIESKKLESKGNMEFVLGNQKKLPTLDEIKVVYAKRREEWNNAPHFRTKISRAEMYRTSVNDKTQAVDWLDMISIFGITTQKTSTYKASGLQIEVKREKYAYEVLTADGMPDMDFYRKNIGRKFFTRYCPDDMSIVSLYEQDATGGMRFVTMAQTFIEIEGALQNQTGADLSFIRTIEHANKNMRIDSERTRNELLAEYNLHPNQHGLNVAPLKGITTSKAKKGKIDIGELQKEKSNMTRIEEIDKAAKKAIKKAERQLVRENASEQEDYFNARMKMLEEQLNN